MLEDKIMLHSTCSTTLGYNVILGSVNLCNLQLKYDSMFVFNL